MGGAGGDSENQTGMSGKQNSVPDPFEDDLEDYDDE
jgi:hypothetical protein